MKKKIHFILISAVFLMAGCKKPLEITPYDKYSDEFVFSVPKKAEEYVMRNYLVLPYGGSENNGYNRLEGGKSMIASASDEAIPNALGLDIERLTNGSWTSSSSNPDAQWGVNYQFIRAINIGLDNLHFMPEASHDLKQQLYGELIFLRAFAHFELIKRYGGIPIVTKALTMDDATLPRNTFEECVNFVVDQCDEAERYVLTPDEASGGQLGRISKGAAKALKARMLLYAASDLYNGPGYDGTTNNLIGYGTHSNTRWEVAAKAAADVMGLGYYQLYKPASLGNSQDDAVAGTNGTKNYADLFYTLTGNKELILIRTSATGNAVEKKNTPVGYTNGQGTTGPSQQMVDAYGMLNGKYIDQDGSGYDEENPYSRRDPRFSASIFYNGKTWSGRAVETFVNGLDNKVSATNTTRTGYYLAKFMSSGVKISGTETKANHCFPLIRYAEILLNFAEAMNEAYGPDADPEGYGTTAREALVELRSRVLRPKDAVVSTPVGDADAMRTAIRRERRVELAFEDHRQLDVRRWKIAPQVLSGGVNGMSIIKNANNSYTYELMTNIVNRVFDNKMYLYPIPMSEMNKNKKLVQNPLW